LSLLLEEEEEEEEEGCAEVKLSKEPELIIIDNNEDPPHHAPSGDGAAVLAVLRHTTGTVRHTGPAASYSSVLFVLVQSVPVTDNEQRLPFISDGDWTTMAGGTHAPHVDVQRTVRSLERFRRHSFVFRFLLFEVQLKRLTTILYFLVLFQASHRIRWIRWLQTVLLLERVSELIFDRALFSLSQQTSEQASNTMHSTATTASLECEEVIREEEKSSDSTSDDCRCTEEFPELYFRSILPQDREQVQALHEEWFPVRYQSEFYETLVQGRLPAQETTQYKGRGDDENPVFDEDAHDEEDDDCSEPRERPLFTYLALEKPACSSSSSSPPLEPEHDVVAFVTAGEATSNTSSNSSTSSTSTSSLISMEEARSQNSSWVSDSNNATTTTQHDTTAAQQPNRIVGCLVGAYVESTFLTQELQDLLVPHSEQYTRLFYIMTLGTADDYRKHGLATYLIQQCIAQQVQNDTQCGALYLHVLDSNVAALRFYEKLGFHRVKLIPNYYTIDGRLRNCYIYAKYFHGAYSTFVVVRLSAVFLACSLFPCHASESKGTEDISPFLCFSNKDFKRFGEISLRHSHSGQQTPGPP
jgi:ribosomal protein S18 acetylase RimI-like enzyme